MDSHIRIATVMNGGVSLAIWMGGVTHELNRLRMASDGTPPDDQSDVPVHAAWQDILKAAHRTVSIDTLAGTSAGGLNGTLLATAIARGADLPRMRDVWLDIAQLAPKKLLREDPSSAKSVLDGGFFAKAVNDLIADISAGPVESQAECTLLVTSTALAPPKDKVLLENGRESEFIDSRRVYRFVRQVGFEGDVEKDDFAPEADPPPDRSELNPYPPIPTAARASASFPVAFRPVWEGEELQQFRHPPQPPDSGSWMIDGGVLDNAPFGPLIDALRERPVDRPFERVVVYVTPATAEGKAVGDATDEPDVAKLMGKVIAAIREPDQRLDMETLSSCFEQMGYTRSAPHYLLSQLLEEALGGEAAESPPLLDRDELESAATALFKAYKVGRAEAFERQVADLQSVRRLAPAGDPLLVTKDLPGLPGQRTLEPSTWGWGLPTAHRVLRWLGRALAQLPPDAAGLPDAFNAVDRAQRQVRTLVDQHEAEVAVLIGRDPDLLSKVKAIRDVAEQTSLDQVLAGIMSEVAEAVVTSLGIEERLAAHTLLQSSLDVEIVSSTFVWAARDEGDIPRFRYLQITPSVPSVVKLGNLESKSDWPSKKLYGERWNHFGAFGTADGRKADWLWGRLDGATTLCDYLLPPNAPNRKALIGALVKAILGAEGSDEPTLRAAAETVYNTTPGQMLRDMNADNKATIGLLRRTIPEVLGEIQGEIRDTPVGLIAEVATSDDLSEDDHPADWSWDLRKLAFAIHGWTWPLRRKARKALEKVLEEDE
jgi:predicted acylesterase/phospholipase RssA